MNATSTLTLQELISKHQPLLDNAIAAIHQRTFYTPYPELPNAYAENGQIEGAARYESQLQQPFTRLIQPSDEMRVSDENSPYTQKNLGIQYPVFFKPEDYVARAQEVYPVWKKTDVETRAALLVEVLERLKADFFEIAFATMHTTGQAFMMSFQASGPHANDRALEAIALGYHELKRFPSSVTWEKPQPKGAITLQKEYRIIPKGVALAIGCSTFPIWNNVPAIFADLVTGNTVIVKPHPKAVYPIAIVVAKIQSVLAEYGYPAHIIQLAVDTESSPITSQLAEHPDVAIIDFTGSSSFGNYLEQLPNKVVFTEKAGVNSVIIDSVADLKAMAQNLAFSVSLYSGQMCTAPQNFFIPQAGIKAGNENISYNDVVSALTSAIKGLVTHEKAGPAVCGAIQNPATLDRVTKTASSFGKVLLESQPLKNPEFPEARTLTPAVIEVSADKPETFSEECFGPVLFVIPTENTAHSVTLAKTLAQQKGAISCGAYTTDPNTADFIAEEMAQAGTPVSFNLTGGIYLNQNAAFSDFHVTGANPAGNASLTDPSFIVRRYNLVGIRKM